MRMLFSFLFAMTCVTTVSIAQPTTYYVPGEGTVIDNVIALTTAGDTISVTSGTGYAPFTVNKAITVRNDTGGTVSITATTGLAVSIDGGEPGIVQGFRFVGGTGSGVAFGWNGEFKNCTFVDNGNGYSAGAVQLSASAKLTNCTITLTATTYPRAVVMFGSRSKVVNCTITTPYISTNGALPVIEMDGSNTEVSGCTITLSDSTSSAIAVQADGTGAVVLNNTIRATLEGIVAVGSVSTVSGNFIHIRGSGIGIHAGSSGSTVFEKNTVLSTACDTAIGLKLFGTTATQQVRNNLFVNLDYAIDASSGSTLATINHNIWWASCGAGSNLTLTSTQMANKEPLFCGARESSVQMYTQRIDSEAAKGNNGWYEVVGARDVECAWGTLARATTIGENSTVIVLEDLIAPSGKVLIIDSGSTLKFDTVDNSNGGSIPTAKNELILNAGLTVNGTSGSKVRFTSAATSPAEGDWIGIKANDVAVDMSYFEVYYADYGIKVDGIALYNREVNAGTFASNQTCDIYLTNTTSDETGTLDITNNTITVGGGMGIYADDNDLDYVLIQSNTLTGSSSSLHGIRINSEADSMDVISNNLSGFSAGDAIFLEEAAALVRGNTISGSNKYGIRQTGGTPTIGAKLSSQAGNSITGCSTTGFLASGSGTNALVRKNTIASNYNNVVAQSGAKPNLGTTSNHGNNDLAGSTNYCLWNRTSGDTVNAYGNWFGQCDDPPGCSSGLVNIGGYLCADPTSRMLVGTEPVPTAPAMRLVGPNPMQSSTEFRVAAGSAPGKAISIGIFDVAGRLVRELRQERAGGAEVSMTWNGRDQRGVPVESGIYFARIVLADSVLGTTKLVVAR